MEEIQKILAEIKPYIDKEVISLLEKTQPEILKKAAFEYFARGGKRFRPALTALSCEALGGIWQDTIPAGAAIEIMHAFALIHDDIEDYSEIRRGKPALHIQYGLPHAINAGDYLHMKIFEALLRGQKAWGNEKLFSVLEQFVELLIITAQGQAMEIEMRDKPLEEATMEWYEKMAVAKTGYYSGGGPCAIGATIAGGTREQIAALKKFGIAIGVAFQIQDDVLNLTMSESEEKLTPETGGGGVGKDFAGDLEEGKRTLILIHCLQKCSGHEKEKFRVLIGKKGLKTEQKKELIAIIQSTKSIEFAKEYAREMLQNALLQLKEKIPETEGRKKLEATAQFLIERKY
ncbi:MAG: polyprenyl synthetase family protein [Candidatus Aenigmarchaeota archaeon]|nr:polyprenyl synthetase family protein [Candidatus Aenigmarchaeota archaeon]